MISHVTVVHEEKGRTLVSAAGTSIQTLNAACNKLKLPPEKYCLRWCGRVVEGGTKLDRLGLPLGAPLQLVSKFSHKNTTLVVLNDPATKSQYSNHFPTTANLLEVVQALYPKYWYQKDTLKVYYQGSELDQDLLAETAIMHLKPCSPLALTVLEPEEDENHIMEESTTEPTTTRDEKQDGRGKDAAPPDPIPADKLLERHGLVFTAGAQRKDYSSKSRHQAYRESVMKVVLPESGVILQGVFGPAETLADVRQFLDRHLVPQPPSYFFYDEDGCQLEEKYSLFGMGLSPEGVVECRAEGVQPCLLPHLVQAQVSPAVARATAAAVRRKVTDVVVKCEVHKPPEPERKSVTSLSKLRRGRVPSTASTSTRSHKTMEHL